MLALDRTLCSVDADAAADCDVAGDDRPLLLPLSLRPSESSVPLDTDVVSGFSLLFAALNIVAARVLLPRGDVRGECGVSGSPIRTDADAASRGATLSRASSYSSSASCCSTARASKMPSADVGFSERRTD
jgi:hypothetical protein